MSGKFVDRRGAEHTVGKRQQVGMELTQCRACIATRSQRSDDQRAVANSWVAEQQAKDLTTGVATGTRHRDALRRCLRNSHAVYYAA